MDLFSSSQLDFHKLKHDLELIQLSVNYLYSCRWPAKISNKDIPTLSKLFKNKILKIAD